MFPRSKVAKRLAGWPGIALLAGAIPVQTLANSFPVDDVTTLLCTINNEVELLSLYLPPDGDLVLLGHENAFVTRGANSITIVAEDRVLQIGTDNIIVLANGEVREGRCADASMAVAVFAERVQFGWEGPTQRLANAQSQVEDLRRQVTVLQLELASARDSLASSRQREAYAKDEAERLNVKLANALAQMATEEMRRREEESRNGASD